jgi:hypothetical protein
LNITGLRFGMLFGWQGGLVDCNIEMKGGGLIWRKAGQRGRGARYFVFQVGRML